MSQDRGRREVELDEKQVSRIVQRLERRVAAAQARAREPEQAATEQPTSDADALTELRTKTRPKNTGRPLKTRGRSSLSVIEEAQLGLFELERAGQFTKHPLQPQSEFPTSLTRMPIFVPGRRSTQRKLLDKDNAVPFSTPWGQGRKHGPPLSIYDEDTLIAIGRLRQNMLIGRPGSMPMAITELCGAGQGDNVHVHVVYCMLTDIQKICGTSRGGKNNKLRLNSVKRLAATTIEFDKKTADKFIGDGTNIKLIDVAWQGYQENALFYIQFTPVMARWFEKEYTYISWELRRKLTDTGKAVHRFLSGQPKNYEIYTRKLKATLGYPREYRRFMVDLREALEQLEGECWIKRWQIDGNGRKIPHKLIIHRR